MSVSKLLIGKTHSGHPVEILSSLANRHGLIAGATGTGKTVTLQRLAEAFSRDGVSVFTADVKGDLAGLCQPAGQNPKVEQRREQLGLGPLQPRGCPTLLWDVAGVSGHPMRATISAMGPTLLGRMLEVSDTQESVLEVALSFAQRRGIDLVDLDSLQQLLSWLEEHAKDLKDEFGSISSRSVGAIQREVISFENSGGNRLFGRPLLVFDHLLQRDFSGQGVINVLDARELMNHPRSYSMLLLYVLSSLFKQLPEVGDLERPKLVFFFDEAHLLFDDAPKALVDMIERVVRLVRSKGVGVYFVTQTPQDIPEDVLAQLGHRVQHALRAFTPKDQKAVRATAETFRQNEAIEIEEVITQLAVGEALVSVLDAEGRPTVVERVFIAPPESRLGPVTDEERKAVRDRSPLKPIYDAPITGPAPVEGVRAALSAAVANAAEQEASAAHSEAAAEEPQSTAPRGNNRQGLGEAFSKTFTRTIASTIARQATRATQRAAGGFARNLLKSIFGGGRR